MTVRALAKLLRESLSAFESDCIIEKASGYSRTQAIVFADTELSEEKTAFALDTKARREKGEPLQYILGEWSFIGRSFSVGKGVLIPRDDTEVAVNAALGLIPRDEEASVLDLCSGSGIIAITLKLERPKTRVTAVEKSEEAFRYLKENASALNADIALIKGDLDGCDSRFPDGSFDIIISNPPYIKTSEIGSLQKEISYEPRIALDGGESGFEFYELIVKLYAKKLKQGGFFVFEIGEEQDSLIERLLLDSGFSDIRFFRDIQNIPRAVTARKD